MNYISSLMRSQNKLSISLRIQIIKVCFDDFKYNLTYTLPVHNREQHKAFMEKNCLLFSNAIKIEEIWVKLAYYWNYLNCSLLEHVVKTLCNETLILEMDEYKKKLKAFRCKTRLCVFAETEQKCLLMGENLTKFSVKYENKWTRCTLQDLENWKESLSQTFLIPPFTLNPTNISPGCVSITWTIPTMFTTSLMEKLKTLDVTKYFRKENKIMSLSFDYIEHLRTGEVKKMALCIIIKCLGLGLGLGQ